jgi:hypothetical protein
MRAAGRTFRLSYPSIDFSAQYARLSTFNNYERYFPANTFQVNNATIGIAFKFPIFNASQRARPTPPSPRPSKRKSKPKRRAIKWRRKH